MSSPYKPPRQAAGFSSQPRPQQPTPERGKGGSKSRMPLAVGAVAVIGLLILGVAVYAGGKDDSGSSSSGAGGAVASAEAHSIAAPLDSRTAATLEVVSGAESLTITAGDTGTDLYQMSTPSDGSLVPTATVTGDTVSLSMVSSGKAGGAASAEIVLSSAVTWTLTLGGGGLKETIDFSGGSLSAVEFTSGAGEIELTLPKATGTMGVTLTGGVGAVTVHLPVDLPVQVTVNGAGAGVVTVDGKTSNGVKAGTEITPDEWTEATDRYTVQAQAGVSTLVVDRVS